MTRKCDIALIARFLIEAMRYAKAQNFDAHYIAELDHLIKTTNHIIREEGVEL